MPFYYDALQTYHYYATNTDDEDQRITRTISDGINGLANYTASEIHSVGYEIEALRHEFEDKLRQQQEKLYKIITEYIPLDISEEEFMAILEEG